MAALASTNEVHVALRYPHGASADIMAHARYFTDIVLKQCSAISAETYARANSLASSNMRTAARAYRLLRHVGLDSAPYNELPPTEVAKLERAPAAEAIALIKWMASTERGNASKGRAVRLVVAGKTAATAIHIAETAGRKAGNPRPSWGEVRTGAPVGKPNVELAGWAAAGLTQAMDDVKAAMADSLMARITVYERLIDARLSLTPAERESINTAIHAEAMRLAVERRAEDGIHQTYAHRRGVTPGRIQ